MPQHSAYDPRSTVFVAELARLARRLMVRVDDCYERGDHEQALRLDEELERRLWFLEHHLWGLAEDEELEEADGAREGEAGVEEQFVAVAYGHLYPEHPDVCTSLRYAPAELLEEHLVDVLERACRPGMAPHGLSLTAPGELLGLAWELARERARLIARYRAMRRARLRPLRPARARLAGR
ncbi:MAG: hypothetical protein GY719_06250 [bacterium]|nr:hypothetical protein [bacterium]